MMNNNVDKFAIVVSSDLDYEKMVINIELGSNIIALLHCDKGLNQTELIIRDRFEEKIIWTLDYPSFMSTLNAAFEKLKQVNGY